MFNSNFVVLLSLLSSGRSKGELRKRKCLWEILMFHLLKLMISVRSKTHTEDKIKDTLWSRAINDILQVETAPPVKDGLVGAFVQPYKEMPLEASDMENLP